MMDSLNCRRRLSGQTLTIKQALFLPDTMTHGEVLLIEFPLQLNCGVSDTNHLIAAHLSVSWLWYVYESRRCPAGCRAWLRYQVESVDRAEAPEAVASNASSSWRRGCGSEFHLIRSAAAAWTWGTQPRCDAAAPSKGESIRTERRLRTQRVCWKPAQF